LTELTKTTKERSVILSLSKDRFGLCEKMENGTDPSTREKSPPSSFLSF
jgi:hypothetical protein